jgi:hypothetical protein
MKEPAKSDTSPDGSGKPSWRAFGCAQQTAASLQQTAGTKLRQSSAQELIKSQDILLQKIERI